MMIDAISTGLTNVISMTGDVLTSILSGGMSAVLPVIGLGIAMGVLGFAVRTIKSLVWGF